MREFIEDWFCHWCDIPTSYTMEDAEADFKELDNKPEGMTAEYLFEVISELLADYEALNQ